MIPDGAEVHSGKSKTLEDAGIFSEFRDSGRYDFLRTKMFAMDRATQGREIPRTRLRAGLHGEQTIFSHTRLVDIDRIAGIPSYAQRVLTSRKCHD